MRRVKGNAGPLRNDAWAVGKVVDRVDTGNNIKIGVSKWQGLGSIYRSKFGACGQAALGCK
jgi:hypothetical protein